MWARAFFSSRYRCSHFSKGILALRYGAIFGPHTRYRAVSDFTTVACLPSLFKKIDDKWRFKWFLWMGDKLSRCLQCVMSSPFLLQLVSNWERNKIQNHSVPYSIRYILYKVYTHTVILQARSGLEKTMNERSHTLCACCLLSCSSVWRGGGGGGGGGGASQGSFTSL